MKSSTSHATFFEENSCFSPVSFFRNLIKAKNYPKIHVDHLDPLITPNDLESVFREYGQIEDIKMDVDSIGHNKGFAYILYAFIPTPSSSRSYPLDLKILKVLVVL